MVNGSFGSKVLLSILPCIPLFSKVLPIKFIPLSTNSMALLSRDFVPSITNKSSNLYSPHSTLLSLLLSEAFIFPGENPPNFDFLIN